MEDADFLKSPQRASIGKREVASNKSTNSVETWRYKKARHPTDSSLRSTQKESTKKDDYGLVDDVWELGEIEANLSKSHT